MKSPFTYGNIVSGNNFCLRKEQKQIEDLLSKGKSVYLVSRKNMGKTSLVFNLNLKSSKIVYIDCKKDNLIQNIAESLLTTSLENDKEKDYTKYFIKYQNLNPSMSMEEGKVVLKINATDKSLEDVESIFAQMEENLILFFDNLEYLATKHKKKSEDVLAFLKNKQSILCESINYNEKLFFSNKTSFSQVVLKPIEAAVYYDFCSKKLLEKKINISKEVFENVLNVLGENSFYRQRFFSYSFNNFQDCEIIQKNIETIINNIIKEDEESFEIIINSLTDNQLKVLTLLAKETDLKIYSSKTLTQYGFQSANAVSKMVQSLMSRKIIYKKDSEYEFFSPLFKIWLRNS